MATAVTSTIPEPEIHATPRALASAAASAPAVNAGAPSVVVLHEIGALREHVAAWDELARAALEPNPYYESWMLLPALRAFGAGTEFRFVLIYQRDGAKPTAAPLLSGFFPLAVRRRCKGLPLRTLELWKHVHCFLCTPLVRAMHAKECLAAFFDWLANDSDATLWQLDLVAADGPFHQQLLDQINARSCLSFIQESYGRAMCRPGKDAETYLTALSSKNRKELRRQRKRLGESGKLECRVLETGGDLDTWLEQFLQLEAQGWKGRAGTALREREAERAFFLEMAREAFRRDRLLMLGLYLDDRPIALKCNFLASPGSFAFKIAFAEDYAKFSPGVLLELENIDRLHALPQIAWMDSCATANHFMIERLWSERRTIQSALVSTGRWGGDFFVSLLPLLRWLRRKFARRITLKR